MGGLSPECLIWLQPLAPVVLELTPLCLHVGGPVGPARSQDFCIWAPSTPLWDVCPDVKVLRGTVGMFNQELGPRLGIYRLGP